MITLPDFMIIGAQKCGTSAMWHTITDHPDVAKTKKEKKYFTRNWAKGINWYSEMMVPGKLNGDASPDYLLSREAPSRISGTVPDVKLIVSFRNPVHRAYSQYQHNKPKIGNNSFEEELDSKSEYLERGRYAEQMKRWLSRFTLNQFLIIEFDSFKENNEAAFKKIGEFIGVDLTGFKAKKRYGSYQKMNPQTKERLVEYYEPFNQQLYELIDQDFDW